MATDSDTLIIIFLWLVYVCLHVCIDYCERRSLLRAEESEAPERAQAAAARSGSQPRSPRRRAGASGDVTAPIAVIVLGADGDLNTNLNEPCEGAVVPGANGYMPVLPEQVHYGESTYMNRQEDRSAVALEKAVEELSPASEVDAGKEDPALK
ncbi:hypothetical protein LINJ_31_1900 [Leishmania infantum JPCM5]|uniref:Uncharacterized protein n=2 Tax=Leishmania infantum TaxID=5671 RepID=E9AHL4_LEIIN|nr:hypothetical protein LINJ_31_1900 [Leishmania infantum JPCM5]CAC9519890.1 hypothetical_protein_-_conserved [Leishmania infantum]CBZ08903.1 hypothetical protein LINJ_31_1900 [Leishmania infantum JPCM5]SUZ44410.1 hypothetical_protein_-_conserved [Leishmania infantum]|eukprot:XP_003392715.1 hypothetical protein LINJ_31_1900 [Leishmania infantum JPCM5]